MAVFSYLGGQAGVDAANEAARIQSQYIQDAMGRLPQWAGRGIGYTEPYTNMGNYVMEQLFGTQPYNQMQGTGQPLPAGTQSQLDAFQKYQNAVQQGLIKPYKGTTEKEREAYITKYKDYLYPLLPRGMSIKDIGTQSQRKMWTANPYPVDVYGNALPEDLIQQYSGGSSTAGQDTQPSRFTGMEGGAGAGNLLSPGQGQGAGGIFGAMPEFTPFSFDFSQYQASPWYQQPLQQGIEAIERSAIGKGGLYSGATAEELNKFGQDYAFSKYLPALSAEQAVWAANQSEPYNRWLTGQLSPMMNLLGLGQSTAVPTMETLANLGTNLGNLTVEQGNALASGPLGAGAAQQNMWNNIGGGIGSLSGIGLAAGLGGFKGGATSPSSAYNNLLAPPANTGGFSLGGFGGYNPFKQAGGPVEAQKPYVVGEAGPELMVPAQSGTVVPNQVAFQGRYGQPLSQRGQNIVDWATRAREAKYGPGYDPNMSQGHRFLTGLATLKNQPGMYQAAGQQGQPAVPGYQPQMQGQPAVPGVQGNFGTALGNLLAQRGSFGQPMAQAGQPGQPMAEGQQGVPMMQGQGPSPRTQNILNWIANARNTRYGTGYDPSMSGGHRFLTGLASLQNAPGMYRAAGQPMSGNLLGQYPGLVRF